MNRRGFIKSLLLGVAAVVTAPLLGAIPVAPDPAALRQQAKFVNFAFAYGRSSRSDIMDMMSANANADLMAEEDKMFLELLKSYAA